MKKIFCLLSALMFALGTVSTLASAEEKQFLLPKEVNVSSFVDANGVKKIENVVVGDKYRVEFDMTVPEDATTANGYLIHFTHKETGAEDAAATHSSKIVTSNDGGLWTWKWINNKGASEVNSEGLSCGAEYHFVIDVDFTKGVQHHTIVNSGGTVVAELRDVPIHAAVSSAASSFQLSWRNDFIDSATGNWKEESKPQNVKVSYDEAYVLDTPELTFENRKVSASVKAYFNDKTAKSPVLLLCVYDKDDILLGVKAAVATGGNSSDTTLTATVEGVRLRDGVKAKAMVINNFIDNLPFVVSADESYSAEQ